MYASDFEFSTVIHLPRSCHKAKVKAKVWGRIYGEMDVAHRTDAIISCHVNRLSTTGIK